MIDQRAAKYVRHKYCPTCGSQRCYGQDDWIKGCQHYKDIIKAGISIKEERFLIIQFDPNDWDQEDLSEFARNLSKIHSKIIFLPMGMTASLYEKEDVLMMLNNLTKAVTEWPDE